MNDNLDISQRTTGVYNVVTSTSTPQKVGRTRAANLLLDPVVIIFFIAPCLLAVAYFLVFASDEYVCESRFVVRGPQAKVSLGVESLLMGAAGTRSPDESAIVRDYMLSRDGLAAVNSAVNLRAVYGLEEIFILNRFPSIFTGSSSEDLYTYYLGKVFVSVDATSGICILTTRAHRAEHSKEINEALLTAGEAFVNEISKHSRDDILHSAELELAASERKADEASLALVEFKIQSGIVDVERQAEFHFSLVGRLNDELISTRAQVEQVKEVSANSPQIQSLNRKVRIIRDELDSQMNGMISGDESLVRKARELERLRRNREHAERGYAAALVAMESARQDSQRKQLYMQRVVAPLLPDKATMPARFKSVVETVLLSGIITSLVFLFRTGVKEHQGI